MKYRIDLLMLLALLLYSIFRVWAFTEVGDHIWLNLLIVPLLILLATTIKHNHVHLPVFNSKSLNILIDQWLNLLTSSSTSSIRIIHVNNHHEHMDSDEDWISTKKIESGSILHLLFYIFSAPKVLIKEKQKWLASEDGKSIKGYLIFENLVFFTFLLLAGYINLYATIISIIIPSLLGQWLLIGFNYLQHVNCNHNSEYGHSNNFTGAIFNFLTFNAGFHTVHHNFPELHWSLLQKKHVEDSHKIRSQYKHDNLCTGLLSLLFKPHPQTANCDAK